MIKYQAHELAKIFPRMDEQSFEELAADIQANGLLVPIVLYQGMILDGVHRQDACFKVKIEPRYVDYEGDDPVAFVASNNLKRRHLNESQRAMCAATLKKAKQVIGKKGKNRGSLDPLSKKKIAKLFNTSPASVKRAAKVIESGNKELEEAVIAGNIAVRPAAEITKLPREEQRQAMRQHMGRQRHKKPEQKATALDLNAAWNRSDINQRRRFIDGIGATAIWEAMPEHQRQAMSLLIAHENEPKDVGKFPTSKRTEIPDDLSIPPFLLRKQH